MKQRALPSIILLFLTLWIASPTVGAEGGPPYDPLRQPAPASPYGMDLMGPSWQWTFPREKAWPRTDGDLRVDLMDAMFQKSWAAGVRSARIAVLWCLTEPERDAYRWGETDIAFQLARNYGMEIVPQIFYTPDWAALGYDIEESCFDYQQYPRNLPPQDWADWSDFMAAIVQRYGARGKNQVHLWEIWNEPDLLEFWYIPGDPWNQNVPEYARLVRLAAAEIDRHDIGGKTLVGSLSDIYGAKFLKRLMALEGDEDIRGLIDILTFHLFDEPVRKMDAIHQALGDNAFEMWITEANAREWRETISRERVQEFFDILFREGVSRTFWFKSWTSQWGPGIFTESDPLWERESFDPSPFYPTYQSLALTDPPPARPMVTEPDSNALVPPRPLFSWRRPQAGSRPIAGYKLQVDDSLFRGKPYFHAPELDVWVPAGIVHFLPLQMAGGGMQAAGATTFQAAPPSIPAVTYQPAHPLPPGRYYWRVAAVDADGTVGPYSEPRVIFVAAGDERVFLPVITMSPKSEWRTQMMLRGMD
ncbi:MAG TPA: hypothetical protein G4O05_03060 [Caldilineae bacterium]|nr:hypothetical protein [Caldilineae bacterium]HIQ12440.1 hypothetical protein [Caldilineales bacterium]